MARPKHNFAPAVRGRTWDKKVLRKELLIHRKVTPAGCWEWMGAHHGFGYGMLDVDGRIHNVCTISLWVFKNDDGPKLSADGTGMHSEKIMALHKCDNPACFRPAHLYSGTQKENIHDAVSRRRQRNSRKDFCKNGHPFDEENTYWRINSGGNPCRRCRACHREYTLKYNRSHYFRDYYRNLEKKRGT